MAKKKREYRWFVEPLDVSTKNIICREVPEENFLERKIAGHCHKLWQCDIWFISYLWKSRKSLEANFRIHSQLGEGKIKDCTFLYQKKRKKRKQKAAA